MPQVVTTLAGLAGTSGNADGTGSAARFTSPTGVAVDSSGNVYVGDLFGVRKITAGGVVTTLAGAAGMLAFAAGTVPALVAVGLAGHAAGRRWRGALTRLAPPILIANALFLGWLAWRLAVF